MIRALGADLVVVAERDRTAATSDLHPVHPTPARHRTRLLLAEPVRQPAQSGTAHEQVTRPRRSSRRSGARLAVRRRGTGGTLMGCVRLPPPAQPLHTRIVAVDAVGSVIFGSAAGHPPHPRLSARAGGPRSSRHGRLREGARSEDRTPSRDVPLARHAVRAARSAAPPGPSSRPSTARRDRITARQPVAGHLAGHGRALPGLRLRRPLGLTGATPRTRGPGPVTPEEAARTPHGAGEEENHRVLDFSCPRNGARTSSTLSRERRSRIVSAQMPTWPTRRAARQPGQLLPALSREAGSRIIALPAYLGGEVRRSPASSGSPASPTTSRAASRAPPPSWSSTTTPPATRSPAWRPRRSAPPAPRPRPPSRPRATRPTRAGRGSRVVGAGVIARTILRVLRSRTESRSPRSLVHDLRRRAAGASAPTTPTQLGTPRRPRPTTLDEALDRRPRRLRHHRGHAVHRPAAPRRPGQVVLNISLRDLGPGDHPRRRQRRRRRRALPEGRHLAAPGRAAVRAPATSSPAPSPPSSTGTSSPTPSRAAVFSPFGLGVLDLAVGTFVLATARSGGINDGSPLLRRDEALVNRVRIAVSGRRSLVACRILERIYRPHLGWAGPPAGAAACRARRARNRNPPSGAAGTTSGSIRSRRS